MAQAPKKISRNWKEYTNSARKWAHRHGSTFAPKKNTNRFTQLEIQRDSNMAATITVGGGNKISQSRYQNTWNPD